MQGLTFVKNAAARATSAVTEANKARSAKNEANKAAAEAIKATKAAEELNAFRDAWTGLHVANVEAFLETLGAVELYPRPGAAKAATGTLATARRLAPIALKAAQLTSYGYVVKGVKYAIAFNGLTDLLLSAPFRAFAEEVVPRLVRHAQAAGLQYASNRRGAVEAELALRLWYLGSSQAMETMLRSGGEDGAAAEYGAPAADALLAELTEWLGTQTRPCPHPYPRTYPHPCLHPRPRQHTCTCPTRR